MYYLKFRDINKEFNRNEFETITFMVSIVFCYTLLLAFACFTIESNPPKWLSFPVYIWPEHPVICCLLGTLILVASMVFYLVSESMENSRDPVKKQLSKIYLVISNILFPAVIFERLLRVLSWLVINAAYMVVNLFIFIFYGLPYRVVVKATTPTKPKKQKPPKHDLKTVLNDVEALVKR